MIQVPKQFNKSSGQDSVINVLKCSNSNTAVFLILIPSPKQPYVDYKKIYILKMF